jgi:hypothetical protein
MSEGVIMSPRLHRFALPALVSGAFVGISAVLAATEPTAHAQFANAEGDPAPWPMARGDFDHDGVPDHVVTEPNSPVLSLFSGALGGEQAAPRQHVVAGVPSLLVAHDVTGDGFPDLIVLSRSPSLVQVLQSTPLGLSEGMPLQIVPPFKSEDAGTPGDDSFASALSGPEGEIATCSRNANIHVCRTYQNSQNGDCIEACYRGSPGPGFDLCVLQCATSWFRGVSNCVQAYCGRSTGPKGQTLCRDWEDFDMARIDAEIANTFARGRCEGMGMTDRLICLIDASRTLNQAYILEVHPYCLPAGWQGQDPTCGGAPCPDSAGDDRE